MLLTCPTCQSGLEVPDGTTAMVRCPACKTVFSPAAGLAQIEADEEPRPKGQPKGKAEADPTENRDFEPGYFDDKPKKKRRRVEDDESLSPDERARLKAAFIRAAIGCKILCGAFALFMLSMLLIIAFWFETALSAPSPAFIAAAGVVGLLNWILAAIGLGLCLSAPVTPGHWLYGIAAAVATGLHMILLSVLAGQGTDYSVGREAEKDGPNVIWGYVPTRLDAVIFYPTLLTYKDEEIVPKGKLTLSIIVGVAEIIRNVLIMMLISCLARAAGDEDVAHNCTRAAGFACFGPGALAVIMLLFAVGMVESNAQSGDLGKILITTMRMGTFAIFIGAVFPAFMATRETADACDEPFQDRIPKL